MVQSWGCIEREEGNLNAESDETTIDEVPNINAPIVEETTDAKMEALAEIKAATTILKL